LSDLLKLEKALWARGLKRIAGVDEAGRGALFGPVVAGAVILDPSADLSRYRDSKTLSESQRERLFEKIRLESRAWSVGIVEAQEIDDTDILRATMRAMVLAVESLAVPPDHILVDGPHRPELKYEIEAVIGGDGLSASIAAASIVAKVSRDRLVRELDGRYPGYGLARNKGYGTRQHLEALQAAGPTPLHRRTFKGVVLGRA
jgi:ribonuclease HII